MVMKAQVISGSTSPIERQHILTEFKATKNEAILLMTLKTGGVD